MRGFLHSLASSIAAMGGIAGFSSDPYRFVPIAGSRNISRDLLKPSRNSKRYPEPHKIGGRQQKRFARQLAAGKLSFFDHDANRRMIADRVSINHSSVEIAEKFDFEAHGKKVDAARGRVTVEKNEYGVPLVMLQSDRHKRDSKNAGLIEYDKSARAWKLTEAGRNEFAKR